MFTNVVAIIALLRYTLCQEMPTIEDDNLVLAQILVRHGDRSPWRFGHFATDPPAVRRSTPWQSELGEMTDLGVRQVYRLGAMLGRMYAPVIGGHMEKSQIFANSGTDNRSIETAQTALAAMLPPADGAEPVAGLRWTPYAVHTEHTYDLATGDCFEAKHCDKGSRLIADTPVYKDMVEEYHWLLDYYTQMTGTNITDLSNMWAVTSALIVQQQHPVEHPLPHWASSGPMANVSLERLQHDTYERAFAIPIVRRYCAGWLHGQIMGKFDEKINNVSKHKMVIHSVHDTNFEFAFQAYGIDNHSVLPGYGASLHLVLRREGGDLVVKAYYSDGYDLPPAEVALAKCADGTAPGCPLWRFAALAQPVGTAQFNADFCTDGGGGSAAAANDYYAWTVALGSASAALLVAWLATCAACVSARRRLRTRAPPPRTGRGGDGDDERSNLLDASAAGRPAYLK